MDPIPERMQALIYEGPRAIRLKSQPVPRPAEGQLLIRVDSVGICGSEVEAYLGLSPTRKPPLVMGHEFCGKVAASSGCRGDWAEGTAVAVFPLLPCFTCDYCQSGNHQVCLSRKVLSMHLPGAFANFVTVDERIAFKIPERLLGPLGSLVEPLGTAIHAVHVAQAQVTRARDKEQAKVSSLAVMGTGTIGLLTIAYAAQLGIERIVGVDLQPSRLEHARRVGATDVICSQGRRPSEVGEQLSELLGTAGAEVVIEAAGVEETRQAAVACVAPLGTIVWLGLRTPVTGVDFVRLVRNQVTGVGSYGSRIEDFREAIHALAEAILDDNEWITTWSLAEGARAFEELLEPSSRFIKVILRT